MHEARYTEHEKESKQGTDEIKKLKEELQELKTRSAIETSSQYARKHSGTSRKSIENCASMNGFKPKYGTIRKFVS